MEPVYDGSFRSIKLGLIVILGPKSLGKLTHLENTCSATSKIDNPCHPVFDILRTTRSILSRLIKAELTASSMRTEKDRSEQIFSKVNPVYAHISSSPDPADLYTDANRWPFLPNLATAENARGEFAPALRCGTR